MAFSAAAPGAGGIYDAIKAYGANVDSDGRVTTDEGDVLSDKEYKKGNKPEDALKTEELYINDTPMRLLVSKVKTEEGGREGLDPKYPELSSEPGKQPSVQASKEDLEDTVTYKVSGRVEGSTDSLIKEYGAGNVEFAYGKAGQYLGYGWLTGTLEYLEQRKAQNIKGESIDIKYNDQGIFEGYAYVRRKLETADDMNRYVAGATMALYDAIEVFYDAAEPEYNAAGEWSGGDDQKWKGVTIVREEGTNNVQMAYVRKGYAGTRTEYVLQKQDGDKISTDEEGTLIDRNYDYQDEINDDGNGVWIAKTIQREDTPILFYSFDNLRATTNDKYDDNSSQNATLIDEVFGKDRANKDSSLYGFDREGNVINIDQYDNRDFSIFVFKKEGNVGNDKPVFEITGGDFGSVRYNQPQKKFEFRVKKDGQNGPDRAMRMYHLDEDGNRDSLVDPTTGIAYLLEPIKGTEEDPYGNEVSWHEGVQPFNGGTEQDIHEMNDGYLDATKVRVAVWPVNTFYDGTGSKDGSATGSHYFQKIITTRPATINADTADEYVFGTLTEDAQGNPKFENRLNPVLDQYGHPLYERALKEEKKPNSPEPAEYVKGHDRYDHDGEEYLGYTYEDALDTWNENAYVINDHYTLYNTDADDPFDQATHYIYSDQQAIKLTVDLDYNFVVNGAEVVPVPTREGYEFCGWLMDPADLADENDGCVIYAYWRNGNFSMSEEDREKWYSEEKQPRSQHVKEITVIFDTNDKDARFRVGRGDIHSTDYPLYRRAGDAYIMNNVWVTGENTPNDPFDEQLVDTVGNSADHQHTYTSQKEGNANTPENGGGYKTANDPYSDTMAGGQADMIKRLNKQLYIMEELEAPKGYVKGMPVAITFREDEDVQYAEMTDHTIKIEIVKADAYDGTRTVGVYRDGSKAFNENQTPATRLEPKGSYSYKHVTGARLTMEGKDADTKKALSQWTKATSFSGNGVKKLTKGSYCYIEFSADEPLYLEGVPAGTYLINESVTPPGYVTMPQQEITVGEHEGVQVFGLADEHTKLEVEKYWTGDDGQRSLLPNSDRAKLALYDGTGTTLLSTWLTDDASDYTKGGAVSGAEGGSPVMRVLRAIAGFFGYRGTPPEDYVPFTASFVQALNENGGSQNLNSVTWTVRRTATRQPGEGESWKISDGSIVTVSEGTMTTVMPDGTEYDGAPKGFKEAYATDGGSSAQSFEYAETMKAVKDTKKSLGLGDQYWNVTIDNGLKTEDGLNAGASVMHVCVSVSDSSASYDGYRTYTADFQFDWKKLSEEIEGLPDIYKNAVSYVTDRGVRRFDYLPFGSYVLKEPNAPEGFAAAADREIEILGGAEAKKGDPGIGSSVQIYGIENRKREMELAKLAMDGTGVSGRDGGRYFAGGADGNARHTYSIKDAAVIAGAKLELYYSKTKISEPKKAFSDKNSLPEGAELKDSWTSGYDDGTYTMDDCLKELIGSEKVGQYKPHVYSKELQDGYYYLVERSAPDYMGISDPVELRVSKSTTDAELASFAIADHPAVLSVKVHKTDDEGKPLSGAKFEVRDKADGSPVGTFMTGKDGMGQMNIEDSARFDENGNLVPRTFIIKETAAPAGYAVDPAEHEFQLDYAHPDKEGDARGEFVMSNANDPAIEGGVLTVKDEPSRISVSKQDFFTHEPVPGTVIEMREAEYVTEPGYELGEWKAKGEPKDGWTWEVHEGDEEFGLTGVAPEKSYVLHEAKVPDGYSVHADVFFRIGTDGQSIDRIWTDPKENQYIDFNISENGEVAGVNVSTRTVKGTRVDISGAGGSGKFSITPASDGSIVLTDESGKIQDGKCYTARTIAVMSDGTEHAVDAVTFIAKLKDGKMRVQAQHAAGSKLSIKDGDGKTVLEINETGSEVQAANPETGKGMLLSVAGNSGAGKDHARVKADDVITYQLSYHGKGQEITITQSDGIVITEADEPLKPVGEGRNASIVQSNGTLSFTVYDAYKCVTDQESGVLTFAAYVLPDTEDRKNGNVYVAAECGSVTQTYMNPVAEDSVPLVISNAMTGSDPGNGAAQFNYVITLTKGDGTPLDGSYGYRTKDGTKRTFEAFSKEKDITLTLTGDDFIVIEGLPEGTRYHITASPVMPGTFENKTADGETKSGETINVLFDHSKNVTLERTTFQKNTAYYLEEDILLDSPAGQRPISAFGFALDGKYRVSRFILINSPTETEIYKTDGDGAPLAGAVLTITDKDGNAVRGADGNPLTWTTDGTAKSFKGVLEAGKTYYLKELSAPDGYAKSKPIPFTVSDDGAVDRIIMEDRETDIEFRKVDSKTGDALAGALLQIFDREGNKIDEWTSDGTGVFRLKKKLKAGETYTLHEEKTVHGYYYSYDMDFTVNEDGEPQMVEMRNRPIIVVNPEEFPEHPKDGEKPRYEMSKERVTLAPEKEDTDKFGFRHGDRAIYDVTIRNTGEAEVTMDVDDEFNGDARKWFSEPEIVSVQYYNDDTGALDRTMGRTNAMHGNTANVTIEPGGKAVVRYSAYVLKDVPECLAPTAKDDRDNSEDGYANTAHTRNAWAEIREYSGEDNDHDGKGDTVTRRKVTAKDFPDGLGDRKDTANTPVQAPEEPDSPSYTLEKERKTAAPGKYGTEAFGFFRGQLIEYEVRISNTGNLPLTMCVDDNFEDGAEAYFEDLKIKSITGCSVISGSDEGVGHKTAQIRIEPGRTAVITYTAKVGSSVPESLSLSAKDDGYGYRNTARAEDVRSWKKPKDPDKPEEPGPGLETQTDFSHTPVQEGGSHPAYEMEKRRVSPAPGKEGTDMFGFHKGDRAIYDVTVRNTGDTVLTMDVTDSFDEEGNFTEPKAEGVLFYEGSAEEPSMDAGRTNSMSGNRANITLKPGCRAVIRYSATVLREAGELLSGSAADDGKGYRNTARTADVTSRQIKWKDTNGDGLPDVTAEEDAKLPGQEASAHTPVQEPEGPEPHYSMEKERAADAHAKGSSRTYGFRPGETVTYKVHIKNDGDLKLTMRVSDEFDEAIRQYFLGLKITAIDGGTDISGEGEGVGFQTARISLEPGEKADVTYTAKVADDAPESLSFTPKDDGNGYGNTARTYDVESWLPKDPDEPDGPDEPGPGLETQTDFSHTPVQEGGSHPAYEMEKHRVSPAPVKDGTGMFGFYRGNKVLYDVTIRNTGDTELTMNVSDAYGNPGYFSAPKAEYVLYYNKDGSGPSLSAGRTNYIGGSRASITIGAGCTAVARYSATVLETAPELLSGAAQDDGTGYRNTARATDVRSKSLKWRDTDGDGEPDEPYEEAEILPDREDEAHTPVQGPKEPEEPSYSMEKERVSPAPEKGGTKTFGFHRGDAVTYGVHVDNTGNMPLDMYVSDEFDAGIARYFEGLQITSAEGCTVIPEDGKGIGSTSIRIEVQPGMRATITYTAKVREDAPESLSYSFKDDGYGYRNIAKAYSVRAKKPDGTSMGPDPRLPDREDEGHTPVQQSTERPGYEMEKHRAEAAPEKGGAEAQMFGFFRGDRVHYDVTIRNTGGTRLTMDVSDAFDESIRQHFSTPKPVSVQFYDSVTGKASADMGRTNRFRGSTVNITIEAGGYAVVRYAADVLATAPECLAPAADDGKGELKDGYLNTAAASDVTSVVREYSGEDKDGDGRGDTMTERTVTKEDFPELADRYDTANTPVQVPDEPEQPGYTLEKERTGAAPLKGESARFGFRRGDEVKYVARIRNIGNMPLTMLVADSFDEGIAQYFEDLKVEAIDGCRDISDSGKGEGIGFTKARVRIEPGGEAEVTFTARVSMDAPEFLSYSSRDDGYGYENTVRTDDVQAWRKRKPEEPEGPEDPENPGHPEEEKGPKLSWKADTAHTPVQEPEEEPEYYPLILLMKGDKALEGTPGMPVLPGGSYQVIRKYTDADGNPAEEVMMEVTDRNGDGRFEMTGDKKEWDAVLDAGETYYLRETKAPDGYVLAAEDVPFTVSRYGGDVEVPVYNEKTKASFEKTDFSGNEVAGAECALYVMRAGGWDEIDRWVSEKGSRHTLEGILIAGKDYLYKETKAPDGYSYGTSLRFAVGDDGRIVRARYVDGEGRTLVYGADGRPTEVTATEGLAGTRYWLGGTELFMQDGNIIGKDGRAIVEGAAIEIPIEDNTAVMKDEPVSASFEKKDYAGNEVAGAECVLYELMPDGREKELARWTSGDSDGPYIASGMLKAGGTYAYREEKAPDGYGFSYNIEFTIGADGAISGAHYADRNGATVLYDADGFPTDVTSAGNGTYRWHGQEAAIDGSGNAVLGDGTIVARGVKEEIPAEGGALVMRDEPIKALFLKTDGDGNALSGGVFTVLDGNGQPVKALRDTMIPSLKHGGMILEGEDLTFAASGEGVRIDGLLIAGERYTVREDRAPEGYAANGTPAAFTAPKYNSKEAVTVTMEDRRVGATFEKTDGMGRTLEGAALELYVKDGPSGSPWRLVRSWTSGNSALELDGVLMAGMTYRWHERKAPEGYRLAPDIYFTVGADGTIAEARIGSESGEAVKVTGNALRMSDPAEEPKFSKTDLNRKELPGATCAVYRVEADGSLRQVSDVWVTDGYPHKLREPLEEGRTYIYRELKAPEGYAYSADIKFVMGGGNLVASAHYINEDGEALLHDRLGCVTGIKANADGTYEMDGRPVIVDASGDAVLFDGTVLAEGVSLDIMTDGNIVPMLDVPTGTVFRKADSVTGESLEGAKLQVLDKDKKVLAEWTTDGTGIFQMKDGLTPGETYTLHEELTVEGYYYSYDVQFTVNGDGLPQVVEMRNRPIIVVTPPDEYPDPKPDPQGTHPDYELKKERVSLAPAKKGTDGFGFFRGDRVLYDVTVTNTGETDLEMTVTDAFDESISGYFTEPEATGVRFFYKDGREGTSMGTLLSLDGNKARFRLAAGGYAVIRYEASVLGTAVEFLSGAAKDDGLGCLNTARSTDVTGIYTEYTGDDNDGDGRGDIPVERRIMKEDYPDELGDKADTAHTPVQEPDGGGENPSYTMDKERAGRAPGKEGSEPPMFGFRRGDQADYDVHVTNTGDMPLTMYVTDEFEERISRYFTRPLVKSTDAASIPEDGTGIGTPVIKIALGPGETATVTFTAMVLDSAPEKLAYFADDDGNGYLNIAKTYRVRAQKPDGTEGGPDEYPGIPDKEDEAHTPVQTDGPKPDYPYIWLLKNSIYDKDHILPGGTFQVLSEDRSEVLIDEFTMDSTWQDWGPVLEADKTYWLHEVNPPEGYERAEDVRFTVSHYGEDVQVTMTDQPEDTEAYFQKAGTDGAGIPGAGCELWAVGPGGEVSGPIDSWTSDGRPHAVAGLLERGGTYRYHEAKAPEGYGWSNDIEFTMGMDGSITDAHYVDADGRPVLHDRRGLPTRITAMDNGTYRLGNEKVTVDASGNAIGKDGRTIAEGVGLSLDADGNTVRMTDAPTEAVFEKTDEKGKPMAGGLFEVLGEDMKPVKAIRDTDIPSAEHDGPILKGEALRFAASEDGVRVTGLLEADGTYWLREINPPEGYKKAADVMFTMGHDGTVTSVTMADEPEDTEAHFAKTDMDGEGVAGAECELRPVEPNGAAVAVVDSWVSDGSLHDVTGILERGRKYRYHEKKAPLGYGWSSDIEFTMGMDGSITDAHYVDADGKPVLHDGNGLATGIAVMDDGTYMLGSEKVTIDASGNAIGADGRTIAEGTGLCLNVNGNTVRMLDVPAEVIFRKESTDGTALRGGRFAILEKDGKAVKAAAATSIPSAEHAGNIRKGEALKFAASKSGIRITGLLEAGRTYLLHEEQAPSGYLRSSDVEFTVPRTGGTVTVRMADEKKPDNPPPHNPPDNPPPHNPPPEPVKPDVSVYKYDGVTMQALAGAKFTAYRNGAEWLSATTGDDGYARFSQLEDGEYRIAETEPAPGYRNGLLEFKFSVSGGEVSGGTVLFYAANYREPEVTLYKRDAEDGTLLGGAKLRISDEDGNIAYEGTTGSGGTLTVKGLKPGHYAVTEIEAPDGYRLTDGYLTFHIAEDGTVTGDFTMYDYKKTTKGRITAWYENGFRRGGWYDSGGEWHPLPKTGDRGISAWMMLLAALVAGAMGMMMLRRGAACQKKVPGRSRRKKSWFRRHR